MQTQEMTLWELAGADPNCVFSPFVWRVRLALYYKGQSYKSVPWRCTEKDLIKPSEKVTFAQPPPAVPFLRACGQFALANMTCFDCGSEVWAFMRAIAAAACRACMHACLRDNSMTCPSRYLFWTLKARDTTNHGTSASSLTSSSQRNSSSRQTALAVKPDTCSHIMLSHIMSRSQCDASL